MRGEGYFWTKQEQGRLLSVRERHRWLEVAERPGPHMAVGKLQSRKKCLDSGKDFTTYDWPYGYEDHLIAGMKSHKPTVDIANELDVPIGLIKQRIEQRMALHNATEKKAADAESPPTKKRRCLHHATSYVLLDTRATREAAFSA
ncbi:hypothetical protein DPSP01_014197 [Paraphaeosphaeria sporulosa]